jgi:hypothetical protein
LVCTTQCAGSFRAAHRRFESEQGTIVRPFQAANSWVCADRQRYLQDHGFSFILSVVSAWHCYSEVKDPEMPRIARRKSAYVFGSF